MTHSGDVKADLIQELSEQMDLQLEEDAIQLDGATTYVSLTDQQAEKVKEQVNKQNEVTGVHLLGCPAAITFLERPNTDVCLDLIFLRADLEH